MILDYEQELTAAGGHLVATVNASDTTYGSRPYDLKLPAGLAADVAIGEPIEALYRVPTTWDTLTSLTLSILADTDGAGGSGVVLASKVLTRGSSELDAGVSGSLGVLDTGKILSTHQYLTVKIEKTGSDGSTGAIKVWLQKGTDAKPANAGSHYKAYAS